MCFRCELFTITNISLFFFLEILRNLLYVDQFWTEEINTDLNFHSKLVLPSKLKSRNLPLETFLVAS